MRLKLISIFAILILIINFLVTNSAQALGVSWLNGSAQLLESALISEMSPDCIAEELRKVVGEVNDKKVCIVTSNGNVELGNYTDSYLKPTIKIGSDRNTYNFLSCDDCIYLPKNDMYVTKQNLVNPYVKSLVIYKDFSKRLRPVLDLNNKVSAYTFDSANPYYIYKSSSNYAWPIEAMSASKNEKWIIIEMRSKGIVLLNTQSFEIRKISNLSYDYNIYSPSMEISITNSGYVAIMGRNTDSVVYEISNACGTKIINDDTAQAWTQNPCPSRQLTDLIGSYRNAYRPQLREDASEIKFYVDFFDGSLKSIKLRAPNYIPPAQLNYLALGDSFSSGEGDVDSNNGIRTSHYLSGTDISANASTNTPEEKCHISRRAYPFKLSLDLRLSSDKMKSVACSGAQRIDVQGHSLKDRFDIYGYEGQEVTLDSGEVKPRLQDIPNRVAMQNEAKTVFTPGRIQQLEFVERTKPKIITLTMGGNDVGFGSIIAACIDPLKLLNTCPQAAPEGRALLGETMRGKFSAFRDLYQRLKEASPDSQIYVLGYPQFISDTSATCGLNSTLLAQERTMMRQSVTYLNAIIKSAASAAGVKYVDIEDSLGNNVLCGSAGEKFVNGIGSMLNGTAQETFHPNAKGHEAMFTSLKSSLKGKSLYDAATCTDRVLCPSDERSKLPPVPDYFKKPVTWQDRVISLADMVKKSAEGLQNVSLEAVKKNTPVSLTLAPLSLKPQSLVNVELHSNPVNLGKFTVNAEGALGASVKIPANVPAGYHTLHVYGSTYSGDPIDYYQIIQVRGADADKDEDGVADANDSCLFVKNANVDADKDGIDDACDAEISSKPLLYRVRNGDAKKGEKQTYMYIERNTRAAALTGISGDYDPDNDGWAIVAASKDANDSGIPANFWIDTAKKPHVAVRTANNGCVQFAPSSLAKVLPATSRTLVKEATETKTCRQEPIDDDVEGDSASDNKQALYRARNGNASRGEDPSKIYLDRSRAGAEAQLGISDFAPVIGGKMQTWNLLASSQDDATKGKFKKLIVSEGVPIVLVEISNKTCVALKPIAMSVIKQQTQFTTGLLRVTPQAGSC